LVSESITKKVRIIFFHFVAASPCAESTAMPAANNDAESTTPDEQQAPSIESTTPAASNGAETTTPDEQQAPSVESTTPAASNANRKKKNKKKNPTTTTPKEVINTNVASEVKSIREKEWSCIFTDKYIAPRKNPAIAYELVHKVFIVETKVSRSSGVVYYVITTALQLMIVCFLLPF
jgi:hypothetical protein